MEKFYDYAGPRYKRDQLSLFRYDRFRPGYDINLKNIFLSCNGRLNDIFEGIAETNIDGNELNEQITRLEHFAYIKCFTETPTNNLMWAHYADNYSGLCFEYDLSLLKEDNECIRRMMPVIYSKKRSGGMEICDMADSANDIIDEDWITDSNGFFYVKANHWRYEKEWRCVFLKNEIEKQTNNIESIDMEFDCVKTIYLGPRATKENIKKICNTIGEYKKEQGREIDVKQIVLNSNTYDLEIQ